MKQCSHCNVTYDSTEIRCPSCASADAKNLCRYCGTVYVGEFCPDCRLDIHKEIINCTKCGNQMQGRVCSKCGHDRAATNSIKESVTSVVSKATCTLVGHKWLGCKCTTCGEIRDKEHKYQLIKDKCLNECTVCAKTDNVPHQWAGNKCIRCGANKGVTDKFWISLNKGLPFLNLEKSSNRALVGFVALFLVLFSVIGIGGLIESFEKKGDGIKVPDSASSYEKMNYKDVMNELEGAGFTAIETEVLDDLITGWLTKDGAVEQVSINGSTDFSSGKYFPTDANIIITYHTFPEKETKTTKETAVEKVDKINETSEEGEKSQVIYDTAVGEMAIDTYNELVELGYTVNLTHDVTKMDFSEDILYTSDIDDASSYIPWIITDLDSFDTRSKTASFFINTQEMLDEKQSEDELFNSLSKKLSPSFAWGAIDMYGKKEFPNGFKLNIATGMLAERAVDENTWFLKSICEIKDEFGNWIKDYNCEAQVSGTSESPKVVDFKIYR